MNSILKGIFVLGAAGAAVFFGLRMKHDKALEVLKKSEVTALEELAASSKNLEVMQAKLEIEKTGSKEGDAYEEKFNQSSAVIAAEKKRIAEIMTQWSKLDAERAAAVKAVRDKEPTRPPETLILADGKKLTGCVIRSVPDEKTVSLEHSGGLGKIPAEMLPADVKSRLGLGWRVDPPAMLDFDQKGNPVAKSAPGPETGGSPGEQLDLTALDMSSVAAVVKSLALVESHLSNARAALLSERAVLRKHSIFKPELVAEGTGKTYRELKEESNLRLGSLTTRVEALETARGDLQKKLKSS